MNNWLPIDSVPRDGSKVDLKVLAFEVTKAWYDQEEGCWMYACNGKIFPLAEIYEPTAWRAA